MAIKNYFRSFSFKIYTLLFVMGIVPIIASIILIDKITLFNQDLQNEAINTINDASDFYKQWAQTQAKRIHATNAWLTYLLKKNIHTHYIQNLTLNNILKASTFKFLEDTSQVYKIAFSQNDLLLKIQLSFNNYPTITIGQSPALSAQIKIKSQKFILYHDQQTKISVLITYGVNRAYADKYELIGEKRHIHRSLNELAGENKGSINNVYRTFFFVIFIIAIVLLIAGALILLIPLNRKIAAITRATERVAMGDLSLQIPVKGKDDLAKLTVQFNKMIKEIKNAHDNQAYIERMEAWREVARRLAHEIKNPLTPLILAIQQLDKKFDTYMDNPQKYRQLLNDVVEIVTDETNTIQKLVKNFSEFAKLPEPQKKLTPIVHFLQQIINLNPQLTENAKISFEISKDFDQQINIPIDPELIRRVIINIVKNANEACELENIEPQIIIKLNTTNNSTKFLISIIDNGPGLNIEQLEKIFQPYYTTKPKGTGLGMAIVRKIIIDHKGDIKLYNREDAFSGTQVDITLPINPSEQDNDTEELNTIH